MNFKRIGKRWINLDTVAYLELSPHGKGDTITIHFAISSQGNSGLKWLTLDREESQELVAYLEGDLGSASSAGIVRDKTKGASGSSPS